MQAYLDFLKHILEHGHKKADRTGTGTTSIFGYQMRFDLQAGFPLVTTKQCHTRSIIHELLWFLKGDTNIDYLKQNGVRIWDEWADQNGNLGPIYGKQWRNFAGVDQIAGLLEQIQKNPDSRRLLICAWNPGELAQMALPPCHALFQFYICDNKLSCQLYQRSADAFLGVPFNIASYALLTHLVAQVCGLEVGEFVHTFGDAHIYSNHEDQVAIQLTRVPYERPMLALNPKVKNLFDFKYEDIELLGYRHHPRLSAPVAI